MSYDALTLSNRCIDLLCPDKELLIWQYEFLPRRISPAPGQEAHFPENLPRCNAPDSWIEAGFLHPGSIPELAGFFRCLERDTAAVSCTVNIRLDETGFRWMQITGTLLEPGRALCVAVSSASGADSEHRLFQEEQLRIMLSEDVIAASTVNLSRNRVEYIWAGLLSSEKLGIVKTYPQMYAMGLGSIVSDEDQRQYEKFFSYDALFASYERGTTTLTLEYRYQRPDGTVIWAGMHASLLRDSDTGDLMFYSYIRSIDAKKRHELRLREKAERDAVTGLYNKATAESMIKNTLRSSRGQSGRCALLIVDLDNFKDVNDNYGHPYGDYVLSETGRALLAAFGQRAIKGRLGGDEFVVFLHSIPSDKWAVEKSDDFLEILRNYSPDDLSRPLTCSIGVAFADIGTAGFQQLYEQADTALYASKQAGKNRCTVYHNQQRIGQKTSRSAVPVQQYVLGQLCDPVFIMDAQSQALLYMNPSAIAAFYIQNYMGRPCGELLPGYLEARPPHQTGALWPYTLHASLQNDHGPRHYSAREYPIDWDGRKAILALLLDKP